MTPPRHGEEKEDQYSPKSYGSIRVHDLEVRGKRYEVKLSRGGSFSAEVHGKTYHGDTPEDLYKRLMAATKRARVTVEVPFSQFTWKTNRYGREGDATGEVKTGIVTGRHQGHGNMLVLWDNGESGQLTERFTSYPYLVPLTPEEKEAYVKLQVAAWRAREDLAGFENDHHLNLDKVVDVALDEASEGK